MDTKNPKNACFLGSRWFYDGIEKWFGYHDYTIMLKSWYNLGFMENLVWFGQWFYGSGVNGST